MIMIVVMDQMNIEIVHSVLVRRKNFHAEMQNALERHIFVMVKMIVVMEVMKISQNAKQKLQHVQVVNSDVKMVNALHTKEFVTSKLIAMMDQMNRLIVMLMNVLKVISISVNINV